MDSFYKLRPHQDLQCYFEQPSAIAAMFDATATSFRVSGEWRQQFDWAVVEWNRDNPIDHPLWRNIPDGDLRGISLSYEEQREHCIPMDSSLFPTVEWDQLRVWTEHDGVQSFHRIPLMPYAVPISGSYVPASCSFTLTGTPSTGDYIGLSWHTEHRTYQAYGIDTAESMVQALADAFNAFPAGIEATAIGSTIELRYVGLVGSPGYRHPGANGNRVGVYGFVSGSGSLAWDKTHAVMSGGQSPERWRVELGFGSLLDHLGNTIDWEHVRKLRWTYAAPVSYGPFERQEFLVEVDNWTVSGGNQRHSFAGTGSRRIEDTDRTLQYQGEWYFSKGNYSGGAIHWTSEPNAEILCEYFHPRPHELLLGARALASGGVVDIEIDGGSVSTQQFYVAGEDALVRRHLASMPAGSHQVCIRKRNDTSSFYFDFLEIAHLQTEFHPLPLDPQVSLSTDWDTDHSLTISPERTVALVKRLGFGGRLNHYVGAMWFYQLRNSGFTHAEGSVTFSGVPVFAATTEVRIGNEDYGPSFDTVFTHLNRVGETAESIVLAFALRINDGSTAIRAEADGSTLRIFSRRLGTQGNLVTLWATPGSGAFVATVSGPKLAGGQNGSWLTDIHASPRINRAFRDWHLSFFKALRNASIDAVTAYSTELRHGDASVGEGIAQRYWDGSPVLLNTPALQTNFSETSQEFWRDVHLETAALMDEAGMVPYMQLGEVQYWYFPNASGMPYYDEDARDAFQALHGRPMALIVDQHQLPAAFPDEVTFLRNRLGDFCTAIVDYVRAVYPDARWEVLYPPDVNDSAIGEAVNFPTDSWTPTRLTCLKTESFTYTLTCDIEKSKVSLDTSARLGFPPSQRAHLVGISDYSSSWRKELFLAKEAGIESITLFALDQMCLVGHRAPVTRRRIHAKYEG